MVKFLARVAGFSTFIRDTNGKRVRCQFINGIFETEDKAIIEGIRAGIVNSPAFAASVTEFDKDAMDKQADAMLAAHKQKMQDQTHGNMQIVKTGGTDGGAKSQIMNATASASKQAEMTSAPDNHEAINGMAEAMQSPENPEAGTDHAMAIENAPGSAKLKL